MWILLFCVIFLPPFSSEMEAYWKYLVRGNKYYFYKQKAKRIYGLQRKSRHSSIKETLVRKNLCCDWGLESWINFGFCSSLEFGSAHFMLLIEHKQIRQLPSEEERGGSKHVFFPCAGMYRKEKHHSEKHQFLWCVTGTVEKLHRVIFHFIIWLGKWKGWKWWIREEMTAQHYSQKKNVERNNTSHTKKDSPLTEFWFLLREKKIWWFFNTSYCRTYKTWLKEERKNWNLLES